MSDPRAFRVPPRRAAFLGLACLALAWLAAGYLRRPPEERPPEPPPEAAPRAARTPPPPPAAPLGRREWPAAREAPPPATPVAEEEPGRPAAGDVAADVEIALPLDGDAGPPRPGDDPRRVYVSGRVIDADNTPVEDAAVEAGRDLGSLAPRAEAGALSDREGEFRLGPLAPGARIEVAARKGARRSGVQVIDARRPGRYTVVWLRLGEGLSVRGRVLAPDGGPAARALVRLERGREAAAQVEVGLEGHFVLTRVAPGAWLVRAVDWTTGDEGTAEVTIAESEPEDPEDVVVRLAPAPGAARISGRVLGPDGEPLAGARVLVRGRSTAPLSRRPPMAVGQVRLGANTLEDLLLFDPTPPPEEIEVDAVSDAAGRFEARVRPGAFQVVAVASREAAPPLGAGGRASATPREGEVAAVEVRARAFGAIDGTVEGWKEGADVVIGVASPRAPAAGTFRTAEVVDGSFRLDGLPAGTYDLWPAEAGGGLLRRGQGETARELLDEGRGSMLAGARVEVRAGERAPVTLREGSLVAVSVRVDGAALPGARVIEVGLRRADLERTASAPGDEGVYLLAGRPGRYEVAVRVALPGPGAPELLERREVDAARDVEVAVALPPAGRLRLRFSGDPPRELGVVILGSAGRTVTILHRASEGEGAPPDAYPCVPAGRYEVSLLTGDGPSPLRPARPFVDVPAGGEAVLEVVVPPGGAGG